MASEASGGAGSEGAAPAAQAAGVGQLPTLSSVSADTQEWASSNRQLRSEKQIEGGVDGVKEAGKSLWRAGSGLTDIVTKPYAGYQDNGWKGGLAGLGSGLVSGIAKPVSHVGSACIDLGQGMQTTISNRGSRKSTGDGTPSSSGPASLSSNPVPRPPPAAARKGSDDGDFTKMR